MDLVPYVRRRVEGWRSAPGSGVPSRGLPLTSSGCSACIGPRSPRCVPRRARRCGRRGHRAGGVPRRRPQPRPLRSSPAFRSVAAPHRRQPGDRLHAPRPRAAVRDRPPAVARGSGSRPRRPGGGDPHRDRQASPDQRAVVVLRYLLEYTPGEIATMLNVPRGTVNSRLRRGLDELQAVDRGA